MTSKQSNFIFNYINFNLWKSNLLNMPPRPPFPFNFFLYLDYFPNGFFGHTPTYPAFFIFSLSPFRLSKICYLKLSIISGQLNSFSELWFSTTFFKIPGELLLFWLKNWFFHEKQKGLLESLTKQLNHFNFITFLILSKHQFQVDWDCIQNLLITLSFHYSGTVF